MGSLMGLLGNQPKYFDVMQSMRYIQDQVTLNYRNIGKVLVQDFFLALDLCYWIHGVYHCTPTSARPQGFPSPAWDGAPGSDKHKKMKEVLSNLKLAGRILTGISKKRLEELFEKHDVPFAMAYTDPTTSSREDMAPGENAYPHPQPGPAAKLQEKLAGSHLCTEPNVDPSFQIYVDRVNNEEIIITGQSSDTVKKVKREIQVQSHISPDKQYLIFAGRELEDGRTLAYYNVGSEAKLYLAVRGDLFQISVRGLNGKIRIVELMFSDTIEGVKCKIRAQLSIQDQQRLIFASAGTLLPRPDRPPRCRIDMSSNFKISVKEQDGRRSTAEMESSNTIDEVMSKINDQFGIPRDQQRLLFAFLRVKRRRARRARWQQQQPLAAGKRRRKSPLAGQGAKVDARPV